MSSEDSTKLSPAWRQAEADLLASGLTYGSLIDHEWLDEAFGLKPAQTIAQHQRNELIRLRQMQDLQASLLENHKMMLTPVRGVGYSVVPPDKQTKIAMQRRGNEVRAALCKMAKELVNVNATLLNDTQRKENTDALAKLGQLRAMTRKKLRELSDDSDPP